MLGDAGAIEPELFERDDAPCCDDGGIDGELQLDRPCGRVDDGFLGRGDAEVLARPTIDELAREQIRGARLQVGVVHAVGQHDRALCGGDDLARVGRKLREDQRCGLVVDGAAVDGAPVARDMQREAHERMVRVARACQLLHRVGPVRERPSAVGGVSRPVGPAAEPNAGFGVERRIVDQARLGIVRRIVRVGPVGVEGELGVEGAVLVRHDDMLLEDTIAIGIVLSRDEERDERHLLHGALVDLVEREAAALDLVGRRELRSCEIDDLAILRDCELLRPIVVGQIARRRLGLAHEIPSIGESVCTELRRSRLVGHERRDDCSGLVDGTVDQHRGCAERGDREPRADERCPALRDAVICLGSEFADAHPAADDAVGIVLARAMDGLGHGELDGLGKGCVEVARAGRRLAYLVRSQREQIRLRGGASVGIGDERRDNIARVEARAVDDHLVLGAVDHLEHESGEGRIALRQHGLVIVLIDGKPCALDLLRDGLRLKGVHAPGGSARGDGDHMHGRIVGVLRDRCLPFEEVSGGSGDLLHREGAEGQHDAALLVSVELVSRLQMRAVHEDLPRSVGCEDP